MKKLIPLLFLLVGCSSHPVRGTVESIERLPPEESGYRLAYSVLIKTKTNEQYAFITGDRFKPGMDVCIELSSWTPTSVVRCPEEETSDATR